MVLQTNHLISETSFSIWLSAMAGAPVTGYQVDYALQPARGRERDAPWQTAYEGPELSCQVQPVHLCVTRYCT